MKHLICGIRDGKAETFLPPFSVPTVGLARRLFGEAVNDKRTEIGKYPKDFTLYVIGDFDIEKGIVTSVTPFELLGSGDSYIAESES